MLHPGYPLRSQIFWNFLYAPHGTDAPLGARGWQFRENSSWVPMMTIIDSRRFYRASITPWGNWVMGASIVYLAVTIVIASLAAADCRRLRSGPTELPEQPSRYTHSNWYLTLRASQLSLHAILQTPCHQSLLLRFVKTFILCCDLPGSLHQDNILWAVH